MSSLRLRYNIYKLDFDSLFTLYAYSFISATPGLLFGKSPTGKLRSAHASKKGFPVAHRRLNGECSLPSDVAFIFSKDIVRMEPTAYKRMLIDISKTISDDEFAALKFLLDQKISKRRMEEMTTILKLFTELENRDELSSSNLVFLRYILNEISEGRKHLTGIIDRATGQSTNGRLPVPADRPQDDNQVNQIGTV